MVTRRFKSYHLNKWSIGPPVTTIASGSAWCGHLTVTQEKQVGSNPIGAAKYLNINYIIISTLSRAGYCTGLLIRRIISTMGSSPIEYTKRNNDTYYMLNENKNSIPPLWNTEYNLLNGQMILIIV